ncbi:unnamed protein product [Phytophthora fragariaefolia]|uniref:Unnamed protein product n=1 Tax=Phytophthora fragariaefolia TaxID=1490495 RepID=A0A9W6YCT1_9STRA|nr:unnamed protein product [Phytophthora fragariaefolia]
MPVPSPPLCKARFRSEDAPVNHVYLKSTWVVTSLRHPALRLLCCLVHALLCFYVGVASPLLTSLKTPASFPVYGDLVRAAITGFTWQKLVFQTISTLLLMLFLRLVAFPRLLQHHWNWECSYRHATQGFSRLLGGSAGDCNEDASQTETGGRGCVLALHTFTAGGESSAPAVRLQVWNIGTSHGSWTFMLATFPILWAIVMGVVRKLVQESHVAVELFPEIQNKTWNGVHQLEIQRAFSTVLVVLSCIRLLMTVDWALQDREYNRAFFGNWLSTLRRIYTKFPVVRIMWCWFSLAAVTIGGVYFGVILKVQAQWAEWSLDGASDGSYTGLWLSNMSWLAFLSALLVALDLLWIIQDFTFPSFASTIGSRMFGLPVDCFTIPLPLKFCACFCSKWLGGFLVMALLLPLEISQVLQIVQYSPDEYEQYANSTTFQVLPLNLSSSYLLDDFNGIDVTNRLMLGVGSLSRYFPWSSWDLAPAYFTLWLSMAVLCWLWRKEGCKMCYAVFLGLSEAHDERVKYLAKLNKKVPIVTKGVLSVQRRLSTLYKLRARSDSFCIHLAALSVLIVWLQFRAIWRSSAKFHRELPLQSPGETYSVLLCLITVTLLQQLYYRYRMKMEIMVLSNQIPQKCRYSIWWAHRTLLLPLLAEMMLCGSFLPPLIHGRVYLDEERFALPRATLEEVPACPHSLSIKHSQQSCDLQYSYPLEIVNMIVLVRLYWFARVIRNQLLKKVLKMTMSSRMLAGNYVPVDSLLWSFRVSFASRPSKVLFTLFAVMWLSTAATVSIFERPFPSKLDGEDHALWLTLVTMTGVGYGDAYPITAGGRIAIVLGAVFGGLAFVSLMTSEFLGSLKGTKREHAVLHAMDRMKWERTIRALAERLILAAWKRHRLNNCDQIGSSTKQRNKQALERRLIKAAHQFKTSRKQKPMYTPGASYAVQNNGLSAYVSSQVDSWLILSHVENQTVLDSLDLQLNNMERSLQTLTQDQV